jgi:hypothetical protein
MMRHNERPRRQRHEFPRHQKSERVIGEHHDTHAGEKRRIEWQHPARRMFVATISEREQAGRGSAEIDHGEEKGRERIETEMRPKPRNSERQDGGRRNIEDAEQSQERDPEQRQRHNQTNAVDDLTRARIIGDHDGKRGRRDKHGGTRQGREHHQLSPVRRTGAPANGRSQRNPVPLTSSAARHAHHRD